VACYLYWEPRTLDEVREVLQKKVEQSTLAEGQVLTLAVAHQGSGTLIGEIVLVWLSRAHQTGEIGYVFHPDHSGQGLATEAARAGLGLAFDELGLHRVIGRLDGRNEASARLLERLGMRREAHFVQNEFVKGRWADEVVYAMLAEEWTGLAEEWTGLAEKPACHAENVRPDAPS
jgi:RimJ/RimL family protein N-acetyltransferase